MRKKKDADQLIGSKTKSYKSLSNTFTVDTEMMLIDMRIGFYSETP